MAEYGFITARVFTSRGQIPIEGASLVVETSDNSSILGARITDENGHTVPVRVQTPPAADSLTPGGGAAFASVNLRISHPMYYTFYVRDAQVFEGQISIQPAELIPIEENDRVPFRLGDFLVTPQNL